MTWYTPLRLLAFVGVIWGVADQGCTRARLARIHVAFAGPQAHDERTRIERAIAGHTSAWAHVGTGGSRRADVVAVIGEASPVQRYLQAHDALLAVRPAGPALEIQDVTRPASVASGSSVCVGVSVARIGLQGAGRIEVSLVDPTTRQTQGHIVQVVPADSPVDRPVRVDVPWLATGSGHQRLAVRARWISGALKQDAPEVEVSILVRAMNIGVAVVEARPSWSARFARLALERLPSIDVQTRVSAAPGIAVLTRAGERGEGGERGEEKGERGGGASVDPQVVLVAGVDALDVAGAARLVRDVSERGRAAVLLLDAPVRRGPWQRLWPDLPGVLRVASVPRTVDLGGHRWLVREWLDMPRVSTGTEALAYVDASPRSPVVLARGLGAGRVVLVSALDAWRWRSAADGAYAQAWQALVQRLAADVPPPVAVSAWVVSASHRREIHLQVRVRPDLAKTTGETAETGGVRAAVVSGTGRTPIALWPAGSGELRGSVAAPATIGLHRIEVAIDGSVAAAGQAVIELVRPHGEAASWQDVERQQRHAAGFAVAERDLPAALERIRISEDASLPRERWWITRQWWFAAIVIGLLGTEWMGRRVARQS